MAMESSARSSTPADARLPFSVAGALGAAFALGGLLASGLALTLSPLGVERAWILVAGAGAALVVGLLTTSALLARLRQLENALAALGRGERATIPRRGWPLGAIPVNLAQASAKITEAATRERLTDVYREEAARQASAAAARAERDRLARDLHDSIKQQLFAITVSAEAARASSGASGAALDDVQAGARAAQAEMTALLQQLRPAPLEHVELTQALRDQATALGYRTGAEVLVETDSLPPTEQLPSRAQEEVFRMAQEALANIARHARARHVTLRLTRQDDAMRLEISDDGQGFDVAKDASGMGLSNLRDRAQALGGAAEITSAPGQGTRVRIAIPLLTPPPAATPGEAERQAALGKARARSSRWFQWTRNLLMLTGLALLLGAPFWLVALSLALDGLAYGQGALAWGAGVRLAGRGSAPELAARRDLQEARAWLLIILALCVGYLPVSASAGWAPGVTARVTGVIVVVLLASGLWSWVQWRRTTTRYFLVLPASERRASIEDRWHETLTWWTIISVILVLGLLFGHWEPTIPPHTAQQWSDAASIALLVALVAINGLETLFIWRWRRAANTTGARESEART
jgi:NarL family two-component system sensor histidine kinase LiaS